MPTAKVEKIIVKHFSHNNWTRAGAKMSLWAETDLGHEVWLQTQQWLDTRRVDTKIREYEEKNKHLLGQTIKYRWSNNKGIGFIREYMTSKPANGLYESGTY